MKTQGLNHIQIVVSNLERSLAFYTGLLGMHELFREGSLVFLQSAEGKDVITLRHAQGPVDGAAGGRQHFGFAVRHEDHAAAVEEARRFGAEVLEVGQHGDNGLYAYIKDPDGYIIEIGG
jgi:catechol 2,3-dioxygenase-like lactoylglutathione lyase family enzyme